MTACTIKVLAIRTHVHIQLLVGFEQGGIQVTVFHAVATTTEEMTGPAIFPGRTAHTLGDLVPFWWKIFFLVAGEDLGLLHRISSTSRELFVSPGLLMADQAVHFCLVRKIEIFTLPSISRMTRCATSLVAQNVHSEVVNGQPAFSNPCTLFRDRIHPCPMDRLVELKCCLVVAGETGPGHLRSGAEFLFEDFVLRMI